MSKEDTMNNTRMKGWPRGPVLAAILMIGMPACLVPPFSSLQDARLVGKGRVELTPFYSSIGSSSDGESSHVQNDYGVQGFWGVAGWLDVGFRYEYLYHPDSGSEYDASDSAHTVAAGPKFSLIKNHFALCLPVGFAFGKGVFPSDTWEFMPTAVFTLPLAKVVDLNLSARTLIPLHKGSDTLYAVNVGLGIRPGGGSLNFRPEAGVLFNPGEGGFNYHLSLGLSCRFGK
jgi:hypothetical protein